MPGGKGVNVARAIKRLGQPVIATGIAGGATGTRIVEALHDESILARPAGVFERLGRALARGQADREFSAWAPLVLYVICPMVFLAHVTVFLLARSRFESPNDAPICAATPNRLPGDSDAAEPGEDRPRLLTATMAN